MAYTDTTTDNKAVAALIAAGSARIKSLGQAVLPFEEGTFRFTFSLPKRTDTTSVIVRVYDTEAATKCEVKCQTAAATIASNGSPSITPEGMDGWLSENDTRITYTFRGVFAVPTGEWALHISTAGDTAAVPLEIRDFRFERVDAVDGLLTKDDLAPAAGMTLIRNAALFEPGIAGSMQRCSFTFDPTNTTDLTIRFKRRGLSLPAASTFRVVGGLRSADRPCIAYVNTAGVYTLQMRENATSLLSYTWTDDFEEHEWTLAYLSTGCTITLDGTVVATGVTAGSFLDTSFVFHIAAGAATATDFLGDHAVYRDVEVIDPATATNKVFLRLDEGAGGPYYNAYLRVGDPLYDATNTSAVQIATTGNDTSRPKAVEINSADGGAAPVSASPLRRVRNAAFGGGVDHATAGGFGYVSWAPTGTPAFNVSFKCSRSLTQAGDSVVWGRVGADYGNINVTAAGVIQARVNGTNICTTTVAAIPPDGRLRTVLVQFRDSGADVTAAIYVDGRYIVSGTLAATQFSAAANNHHVGGNGTTGFRRWSGIISDVLIEDLNSAANSGFYLMDEISGAYVNTYPGGTLGPLARSGYVGVAAIESEDGRGRQLNYLDVRSVRNRYAAKSLAGTSSTVGAFTDILWAPSTDGAEDFTIGGVFASRLTHTNATTVLGRIATNGFNLRIGIGDSNGLGDIIVYENSNSLLSASQAFSYDGQPHEVCAHITPTTCALYINGALVKSTTFASVNWSNVAAQQWVGSNNSASARWPGSIHNVRFIDHKSATNCIWLNMDEPPTTSTYANAYAVATDPLYNAGTTTPATATKATGASFPWVCSVTSGDGRGMPWQGVGPLVYNGHVVGVAMAADNYVASYTEITDPTASFNTVTGLWTAPCAGNVDVLWVSSLKTTAFVGADLVKATITKNGAGAVAVEAYLDVAAAPANLCASRFVSVVAGDTIGAYIFDITANTYSVTGELVIRFYPTPTTG